MEESLYSESGFFNTTKVRSNIEGDFLTSPEVSKYFGKFNSHWMNENKINSNVVEIGAGTGSLALQIQEYSTNKLFLVEKSNTAFRILKQKEFNVFETLDLIPIDKVNLIYMNEVLDNIPCSIGVYKDGVWFEKIIKIESDSLSYELGPMRPDNLAWIESNNIQPLGDIEIEIQKNATKYLEGIVSKFNPHYLLIIDYGYEFHERASIPYKSLIRTYKNHHLAGESLLQPTTTDITYDINFSSIENCLSRLDYAVELHTQKEFLQLNGFEAFYKKIQTKFQNADGLDKLKIKSDLVGLEAINNNRGLGGFKMLITKKI